ncbi:MAG: glycosyltransferase [Mariprofundus sp.]|nr:glycosyltransferase [Mariprofundus sp.]
MPNLSLAVVISTYNTPKFLSLVLDGYRQQTDNHFSIYIADDGSKPETSTLIKKIALHFPIPIQHIWQRDNGFRKARIHNKVIQQIKEPHVLLTDGDCIPLPGLIAAHRRYAAKQYFISGSRILLSQDWTKTLCKRATMHTNKPLTWWLNQRIRGNINRLSPLLLSPRLSAASEKLEGIRGCHLSCPTEALLRINGFDESFEGWGREDSDLTARLLHAGLKRRNLRAQPVLHLWHQECSRQNLEGNDSMLQACLKERRIEAIQGLKQLQENV